MNQKEFHDGKPIKSEEGIRGRQITGSQPDHDRISAEYTLERPYVVWSPDWPIEHVCLFLVNSMTSGNEIPERPCAV
jgi:hypothetical protein